VFLVVITLRKSINRTFRTFVAALASGYMFTCGVLMFLWKYVCRVDFSTDIRGTVDRYVKYCAKALDCTSIGDLTCEGPMDDLHCSRCKAEPDNCLCSTLTTRLLFTIYSFYLFYFIHCAKAARKSTNVKVKILK